MSERLTKIIFVRIPVALHKRMKIMCAEKEVTLGNITAQILENFVDMHEEQKKVVKVGKGK